LITRRLPATFLADVVHSREAEHVRSDFPAWVISPVLAVLEQPGDVQTRNAFGPFRRDLPLEENKVPARVGEASLDFPRRHLEQCPQTRKLPLAWMHFARDRPYRFNRGADGERFAVAVKDAAAVCRNFDNPAVAGLAFCLQKIVVQALQVDGAAEQHGKASDEDVEQESRAPRRQGERENRAGGEIHFAVSCGRTMWRRFASGTRMCSWRLAMRSTRACTAHVLASSCS
jgi:hypothetical protein